MWRLGVLACPGGDLSRPHLFEKVVAERTFAREGTFGEITLFNKITRIHKNDINM